MKIAAIQMDILWHDRDTNLQHAAKLARQAVDGGAEMVIFPEMFSTGFSLDPSKTAEKSDGPTPVFLRKLASDNEIWVVGGFVLGREKGKPYNVALTVNPRGEDVALYAKMHLIPLMNEQRYHHPGESPQPFEFRGIGGSVFICYDLRFPEIFRVVVDRCGLYIVIASWPAVRMEHWEVLLCARAVENQAYVVGVNRIGSGGGYRFSGGSVVVDPAGKVIARGDETEDVIMAEVMPDYVLEVREKMPFLKDRR